MTARKLTLAKILAYYIIFFTAWASAEFFFTNNGTINEWVYALIKNALKFIIWTIPSIILLRRCSENVTVSLREIFVNKVKWLRYLPIFAWFAAFILIRRYITHGEIDISADYSPVSLIGGFIFVGITEEMVFRGWLLNATLNMIKPVYAVLLNAVLFLLIHFPAWIHSCEFMSNIYSAGFLTIMILSVIFSVSFIKSRNILVPIFLHMFWDLLKIFF